MSNEYYQKISEQDHLKNVYDQANQLYLAGYQLTIIKKYNKKPIHDDWQNKYSSPIYGMTGVGIVGGSHVNGKSSFVYMIDIDIYQPEKREKVFNEIMALFGSNNIYFEKTTSNGYHLIFHCETKFRCNKYYYFNEKNTSTEKKDHIEFFTNGFVVVAPSLARNKQEEIGEYKKISAIDIVDSAVLTDDEAKELIFELDKLSNKYTSTIYQHRHKSDDVHLSELNKTYLKLISLKFVSSSLFDGNRYPIDSNIDQVDVRNESWTGIRVALGMQKDKKYLICLNYNDISDEVKNEIVKQADNNTYIEESVSGGLHILYRTNNLPKVIDKRKLPGNGSVQVLYGNNQTVNSAPTCSYIRNYQNTPIYRTSKIISGSLDNIGYIDSDQIDNYLLQFEPMKKNYRTETIDKNTEIRDTNMVMKHIHQYGMMSEIDKQIKLLYPNTIDLLNVLNIDHAVTPNENYLKFFTLSGDDGRFPGAVLFHNRNNNSSNKWNGYSVNDFHTGEMDPFSKYLCKHDPDKFDQLMNMIGFGKVKVNVPIQTTFNGQRVEIKAKDFISEEIYSSQVISLINETLDRKIQPKIVITAPTGMGKTEMFYRLARQQKIQMIMALCYTAQVQQGKEHYSIPGVLEGMCDKDYKVPLTGSIYMTYDKAPIVQKKISPENYIMVIDEAHNLVNHIEFRNKQMHQLRDLSDNCKAIVYMTATPDYINYKDIDLMIKIESETAKTNIAKIVHYKSKFFNSFPSIIINQHQPGKIDVIYIRNSKTLDKLKSLINSNSDLEAHVLNAEVKADNPAYNNIINMDKLAGNGVFESGGILLTTNLIVDGVNIKDDNIGNVYLVNPESTTDLVQFPARFRNDYNNYYIFSTGIVKASGYSMTSRQDQVDHFYFRAYMQKKSFNKINYLINGNSFLCFNSCASSIQLKDQYELLNDNGEIQDEKILFKVQKAEAFDIRKDINNLKKYLEASDYNYSVTQVDIEDMIKDQISTEKISSDLKLCDTKTIDKATKLINILKCDSNDRKELISDYLKRRHNDFKSLRSKYDLSNHIKTNKYVEYLNDKECSNLIFKWCTGEDLGADQPLKLLVLNDTVVDSLKRTLNNLIIESNNRVNKDNKYIRFIEVRKWIRSIKNGKDSVRIDSNIIKDFIKEFNSRFGNLYNPNKIDGVVNDLNDIFQVKKVIISGKSSYDISYEWTLENIRGISFAESRR